MKIFSRTIHGSGSPASDSGRIALYARAYSASSFDVVTLWATLEHLVDPNQFLAEARRILRPSGRIALSVPNHGGLIQRLLGRRYRYVGIDHVNYFTARVLRLICERHGFTTLRIQTDKFNPIVVWQDLRGRTQGGASIERQLDDQRATDALKYGARPGARLLRASHWAVRIALRATGLGDLLYFVGRK